MDYYILMSSEGIPFKTNIENNAQVVKIAGLLFDFILYSKELWMILKRQMNQDKQIRI